MATVDITPDVSLLKKAGEVNYKIPAAVAELVDNEIDARVPGQKLTVEVTTGQKRGEKHIVVAGNGSGMSVDEAKKAMVMAYSTKEHSAIGEFGLGMKTACSFLGRHFEVTTATADAERAVHIVYDEDKFLERGKWEIDIDEVEKPFEHGTIIRITDPKVNVYPGVKNIILDKFGKLFKHFVADGDVEILVNGDVVIPVMPETIPEYDKQIDFEVNGKRVRGWAGLLTRGSPKGAYGFDLVRHGRVMDEHVKLGFNPSSTLSRLVGELHLDDFPVTNNKTDFRRDTEEFEEMVKVLNEEWILDLKRESRNLATPGKFAPKDQAEVDEFVEEVQAALKEDDLQQDLDRRALDSDLADEFTGGPIPFQVRGGDEEGEPSESDDGDTEPRTTHGGPLSTVDEYRLRRVKTQLRNLQIEHNLVRLGRGSLYKIWDVEGVGNKKKLVVTTNIDHPLYSAIEAGFMLWVKHNIVEAVAEFFTESTGKTDAMLLVKSDILKHVGKMKLEIMEAPTYETEEEAEAAESA